MSIQILPENPNLAGRIGNAFGRGLSDTVPKEIERYRLKSGLQDFQKNMAGKNPLQLSADLLSIPGMTPEYFYSLSPLLQQQQKREAGPIGGQPSGQPTSPQAGGPQAQPQQVGASQPFQEPAAIAGQKKGLKSLESTQAQVTPFVDKTDTQLFNEAQQLSRDNPVQFPTPESALSVVKGNEATRKSNFQEQRNVGDAADALQKRVKSGLDQYWAREKTESQVPGTVQTKLLRNIEHDLADPNNKLSEQQLINKYGEVGKRLAKADTIIEGRGKDNWFGPFGNYTPKKIEETINNTRKPFAEAGALEEYQDKLTQAFNLSAPGSAYLAYPPENKKLNSFVNSVPKVDVNNFNYADPKQNAERSVVIADALSGMLDTGEDSVDSILSYIQHMKSKNIDSQKVLDRLNQNIQAGVFTPNARQKEELAKGIPAFPSFGDIFLYTLLNKDKLIED